MAKLYLTAQEYRRVITLGKRVLTLKPEARPTPNTIVESLQNAERVLHESLLLNGDLSQLRELLSNEHASTLRSLNRSPIYLPEVFEELKTELLGRDTECRAHELLSTLMQKGLVRRFIYAGPGGEIDLLGVDFLVWLPRSKDPCPLQVKSSRVIDHRPRSRNFKVAIVFFTCPARQDPLQQESELEDLLVDWCLRHEAKRIRVPLFRKLLAT